MLAIARGAILCDSVHAHVCLATRLLSFVVRLRLIVRAEIVLQAVFTANTLEVKSIFYSVVVFSKKTILQYYTVFTSIETSLCRNYRVYKYLKPLCAIIVRTFT